MLIRSQNRMDLVNVNTVSDIYVQDACVYCTYPDDVVMIGEYNTDEEALAALDSIQNHYLIYQASEYIFMMPVASTPAHIKQS